MKKSRGVLLLAIFLLGLTGCAGTRTFHEYARAGDTVALAAGWKQQFSKNNITVTFTPAGGFAITYLPDNPAIRAVMNLYPDPLSSIVVSNKVNQDLTPYARTYADMINFNFTGDDRDWWQTVVFLDLPPSLTPGECVVQITNPEGETAFSNLEIIAGVGSPSSFSAELNGQLSQNQLNSFERVAHATITFSGDTVPFAMQLEFSHDPDVSIGGIGVAHVVNPRGDLKNLAWTDDGTVLKVVITPANLSGIDSLKDCKFYVAGGITNLSLLSLQSLDQNGNTINTITATMK